MNYEMDSTVWAALNYSHPTFYPEVIKRPVIEHRRCHGIRCAEMSFSHEMESMWVGKNGRGNKIYFCNSCKETYTGEFILRRVGDEPTGS